MNERARCCLSNSILKPSPFLLFLVRSEADVCRAGLFSMWQTQFPQLKALTARTKWVLITLCPNQMMDCPSGYHGYCVCILVCTCVCFLGERPRGLWKSIPTISACRDRSFCNQKITSLNPTQCPSTIQSLTSPLNHLW